MSRQRFQASGTNKHRKTNCPLEVKVLTYYLEELRQTSIVWEWSRFRQINMLKRWRVSVTDDNLELLIYGCNPYQENVDFSCIYRTKCDIFSGQNYVFCTEVLYCIRRKTVLVVYLLLLLFIWKIHYTVIWLVKKHNSECLQVQFEFFSCILVQMCHCRGELFCCFRTWPLSVKIS